MPYKNCENCAHAVRLQVGIFCQRYGMVTHALCEHWKQQITTKTTNADHIRNMSDEELAKWIWNRDIGIVEKASKAVNFTFSVDREKCEKNLLNWLKEEVGE